MGRWTLGKNQMSGSFVGQITICKTLGPNKYPSTHLLLCYITVFGKLAEETVKNSASSPGVREKGNKQQLRLESGKDGKESKESIVMN